MILSQILRWVKNRTLVARRGWEEESNSSTVVGETPGSGEEVGEVELELRGGGLRGRGYILLRGQS